MKTVTALTALACAAALALTGCGPKAEAPGADAGASATDSLFPKRTANYMAKYTMTAPGGALDQVQYGSGAKRRMEINVAGRTQATIVDPDAQSFLTFAIGPGAPKTAMKLDAGALKEMDRYEVDEAAPVKPKKVGTDTVAGETCTLWEVSTKAADPAAAPTQMCVTDDGIALRLGPAAQPQMIATEVKRGAQDPKLFQLPEGYTVVDLGECMAVMQAYGQAMSGGGPKPDPAKLADCQKKMMAGMGAP